MPGTVQDVSTVEPMLITAKVRLDAAFGDQFLVGMEEIVVREASLQIRDRGLQWADPTALVITPQPPDDAARYLLFTVEGWAHETPMARKQRERLEMSESAKDNVMAREQEMERQYKAKILAKDNLISELHLAELSLQQMHADERAVTAKAHHSRVRLLTLIISGECVLLAVDAVTRLL